MTLNPQFMISLSTDEDYFKKTTKETTLRELKKKISKSEKLTFVTFYFNTKPSRYEVSGGIVSPDVSDFLVLLHLNTMIYFINKIYGPGCVMKLGSELNYFHSFAQLTKHQTDEMQSILQHFNTTAESFLGSKGQVILYDILKEVNQYKDDFELKVEIEKYNFLQQVNAMEEINKFSEYYINNVLDPEKFPNEEAAWNFALFHTLDATGYKNALVAMFDTTEGIFKDFSKALYVQSRFVQDSHINKQELKPEIYCSMLPGASTFSFNMLSLRTREGKWKQIHYEDVLSQNYKPLFVQDLNYPFFYEEEKNYG